MAKKIIFTACLVALLGSNYAQRQSADTSKVVNLKEVVITSNKIPIRLINNPGAVTLIGLEQLKSIPKGVGVEEALRLTPGVRIDNQHDGERVHVSIRGQGILTERGLRGIGVMVDGIPVNDPSGFAPDLYDVDWSTVGAIEVLRGPLASIYGGSGAAGVLNINTVCGGGKPLEGELSQTFGSNGFSKSLLQLSGSSNDMDYRASYSRTDGDGYRDHQAYWSNKLSEKVMYHPSEKLSIQQIVSHVDYFQQNPEGLNLGQFNDLKQANPDACPFNEYQKTNRTTLGATAKYLFSSLHDVELSGYLRNWNYKETSNRCAEYRAITNPGMSGQYNLHLILGEVKNHFSAGADLKWQKINMYKLQSASDPNRVESTDETNLETDSLMANQIIWQRSVGGFFIYHLEYNNFNLVGSVRYDYLVNELTDKMKGLSQAITSENFDHVTARIGASYQFADAMTLFTNWSQGFIPPSTEELANNPMGYSGFNEWLKPALSNCYELGLRGSFGKRFYYEITGFYMKTDDDFFRFKQSGRGNQEVFYGNAGNSERKGIEFYGKYNFTDDLSIQLAYTYSDFKYTSATVNPIYTDTAYVLTTPPADGQWLPNCPKHQLYGEINYRICPSLRISAGAEYQSKWAIYTDAKAYNGEMDPTIYQNWQDGFNLFNASAAWSWKLFGLKGELSCSVRNLTGEKYMAFTEPDPDGNSYQPGPSTEVFGKLKIRF